MGNGKIGKMGRTMKNIKNIKHEANMEQEFIDDERVDCGGCKHRIEHGWDSGRCRRRGWSIPVGILNHCSFYEPKIIRKKTVVINDDEWYMD